MANITAQMIKELREKTSAGMMDCKKALTETDGNMEEAVDWMVSQTLVFYEVFSNEVKAI